MFGFELRLPPTNANRMAHARINTFGILVWLTCSAVTMPPYIKTEMLSASQVQFCPLILPTHELRIIDLHGFF